MSSTSFWDVVWLIMISFAFIAYLIVLFAIITDLFRDHSTKGWVKAIWVVFLFIIPLLSALVYLIVNGSKMTKRSVAAAQHEKDMQDAYIKQVAGPGHTPAQQIADAQQLRDSGAITDEEFERLKAKALS